MKRYHTWILAAVLVVLPLFISAQVQGIIPGDILVMLSQDGDANTIAEDLRVMDGVLTGIRVEKEVSAPMRIWLLKFDHSAISQQRMLEAIKRHDYVMMAQNDHPVSFRQVPNDPNYGQQWQHQNIQSELAWDISTGGLTATGDTIVVCVVEASNLLHSDLVTNHWRNHGEVPDNGIDDDANGYTDDYLGWNPGGGNDNVYNGGHGTNVAGMIGATGNNGMGVAGANWNVKIMVVTVGSLSQSNVIESYTYPLVMRRLYNDTDGEKGAFVVATNASWGIDNGDPDDYPLWCAIYDTLGTEGVLSCGATANNNVNIDVVGDLPTGCASDFMISVTATNSMDNRTFSGYGATTIDVGAPGSDVYTTSGTSAGSTSYTSTSGTSFASPLTAGVIGLLYSAPCPSLMALVDSDPMAGAAYIRQVLFDGVDQVGNLGGQTVTGGRINAANSIQLIMASCGACPAPYAPAVQAMGVDEMLFTWNAFSDPPYSVRYRAVGDPDWIQVDGLDELSYLATGLELCTAYEFQAGSVCEDETVEFSVSATLEPQSGIVPTIAVSDFPAICAGESITLTSSSTFGNLWNTGSTEQSIEVTATGNYTLSVQGSCDTLEAESVDILVLDPAPPVTQELVLLPGPGTADLTATGDSILWYALPAGGIPLGIGASWQTPMLNSSTSFWCANVVSSDAPATFGGPEDRTTDGQYHPNASFYLLFTANEPFVLRSVKVFANGAGARPIGLVNTVSGNTVVQGNFNIPDGESRVELGFTIPAAGNYALRIMSGNPQLWRDGIGSNPDYPFSLGQYGAITSSSVTGANQYELYYFFYDWEVEPLSTSCESERVEVVVEMPVGIDEDGWNGSLDLYPNPTSGTLFVELNGPVAQVTARYQVLDHTGRIVLEGPTTGSRTALGTTELADGMYLIRLVHDGEELGVGRFTVTR